MLKLAFVAMIGVVSAVCPNACSGHGTCGASDLCTCYSNWIGNDCSERVCAYGYAWADSTAAGSASGRAAGHHYAECSNKGVCDRKKGECKCFDGYEGKACRRSVCPNKCSGHGTCEYMEEIVTGYDAWDAKKVMQCRCDPHWSGADCSSRMCPKSDDPLTTGQVSEVQTVSLSCATTSDEIQGDYSLVYTDSYGGVWTTRPIDGKDGTGSTMHAYSNTNSQAYTNQVEEVLKGLPYWVIDDVRVTSNYATGTHGIAYDVTFTGSSVQGDQVALTVLNTACSHADGGCYPRVASITCTDGSGGGSTLTASVTETVKGTTENAVCSNRGNCDGSSGTCECFDGFTGDACQTQTIYF